MVYRSGVCQLKVKEAECSWRRDEYLQILGAERERSDHVWSCAWLGWWVHTQDLGSYTTWEIKRTAWMALYAELRNLEYLLRTFVICNDLYSARKLCQDQFWGEREIEKKTALGGMRGWIVCSYRYVRELWSYNAGSCGATMTFQSYPELGQGPESCTTFINHSLAQGGLTLGKVALFSQG